LTEKSFEKNIWSDRKKSFKNNKRGVANRHPVWKNLHKFNKWGVSNKASWLEIFFKKE